MNTTHPKILAIHLKRLAVIYIRQSSPLQVENHLESKARQYQLTERAQFLGWPSARCVVSSLPTKMASTIRQNLTTDFCLG